MKSIKIFQIHQRIRLEHFQNFRELLTHGFAHAKVKQVDFQSENSGARRRIRYHS